MKIKHTIFLKKIITNFIFLILYGKGEKKMKLGKEIADTDLRKINGGGFMSVVNNWTPVKTAWDFGNWTADRVFGDLMGWKKR